MVPAIITNSLIIIRFNTIIVKDLLHPSHCKLKTVSARAKARMLTIVFSRMSARSMTFSNSVGDGARSLYLTHRSSL